MPNDRIPTDKVKSEEALIAEFLAPLASGYAGAFDLKDDCAVVAPPPGHDLVLKTDAIAEGVHFLPDDDPADIGWKALAVNVSDLAAKGAKPLIYLMSLAFPEAPQREWMARFTAGLAAAQHAFDISLAGGDTDRRPGPISITPTVLGTVPTGRMVLRTRARPGDVVVVSGTLGDAALGLALRRDAKLAARWHLSPVEAGLLVGRYLRPAPRLALREALLAHAGAAMDLSDGLLKDLGRMCRASGVGAVVEQATLPASAAFAKVRACDQAAADKALFAGDDYEVLAAVAPEMLSTFKADAAAAGVTMTAIGCFGAGENVTLLDAAGAAIPTGTTGWDHF